MKWDIMMMVIGNGNCLGILQTKKAHLISLDVEIWKLLKNLIFIINF